MLNKIDNFLVKCFNIHPIDVHEVFTPTVCATYNYVPRKKLEQSLTDNFDIPGLQLVVYGHSGSGKTTIVRSLLNKNKIKHITTKCESSTKYTDILFDAFDQLDPFATSQKVFSKSSQWNEQIKKEYKGLQAQIFNTSTTTEDIKQTRILPPQLTAARLANMLGRLGLVWVIEDFHKVEIEEKHHLADLLKVFVDNANDYPKTKIICIGACNSAQELISLDSNIRNRIAQIHVQMLSNEELTNIVTNGAKLLNIVIDDALTQKIVYYSGRIGATAHNMCLDICKANGIQKRQRTPITIYDNAFNIAVQEFMNRNSDTLKTIYDAAVANELGWYILKTFSCNSHEKLSINEIEKRVNMSKRIFNKNEISEKLSELSSEQYKVLYYHKSSNLYSIANPFWKAFLRMQFAIEQSEQNESKKDKANLNLKIINQNDSDAIVEKLILELLDKLQKITGNSIN